MYRQRAFHEDDPDVVAQMFDRAPFGHLVTTTPAGLAASAAPFVLVDDGDGRRLLGHLARANPQWRDTTAGSDALVILPGPDAYVSPGWYASKREHGRVVPTWDYELVHVHGPFLVHDDTDAVLDVVTRLTRRHEAGRPEPWSVEDAPSDYLTRMLRAVVAVEIPVRRLEAARKLSQNRDVADRAGVVSGLAAGTERDREVGGLVADA